MSPIKDMTSSSGRASPTSILDLPLCRSPRNSTCEDTSSPSISPRDKVHPRQSTGATVFVQEPEHLKFKPISQSSQDSAYDYRPSIMLSNFVQFLVALCPYETQRYERRVKIEQYTGPQSIRPYTTNYSKPKLPDGWIRNITADGAPYFYKQHIQSADNHDLSIIIMTDANIYVPEYYERISTCISNISEYLGKHVPLDRMDGCHLALELREPIERDGKQIQNIGYYFIDHRKEILFWFDDFDMDDMKLQLRMPLTDSHLGHEVRSQYWRHNESFPSVYPYHAIEKLLPRVHDELIGQLGELLTAPSGATTTFDEKTLSKFLSLCQNMKAQGKIDVPSDGTARLIFRLLATFEHERFVNSYGEANARLSRQLSIYGARSDERTWFIWLISPFLFFAPMAHLHTLEDASVDNFVRTHEWMTILNRLITEWKEHVLYSTVLLNANVAFLTIQSIDVTPLTLAQKASYFSIGVGIGAIVTGLILCRQHDSTIKCKFLVYRSASRAGLETLAVMYSIPYALLIWGMISFFVAFASMCYSKMDLPTNAVMTIAVVALLFMIIWLISASYEKQPYWHPAPVRAMGAISRWAQGGFYALQAKLSRRTSATKESEKATV